MIASTIRDINNIEPACAGSLQNTNPSSVNIRQIAENSAINFIYVFTLPEDCFISKCDLKTLLNLRKVSKYIYNNIPMNKLFHQFSIENPRYSKNGFSYQAYNNTIGLWLNIIAPRYKNKIDKYISAFPENKFNARFSEYLFSQINILQKIADLSALKKYKFSTYGTRCPLPSNTKNTCLSDCGQYLIVLNHNHKIIISLITAGGLQQIKQINYYFNNPNISINNIAVGSNNIIIYVLHLEVHLLKLNPIECDCNSQNITIYKPYDDEDYCHPVMAYCSLAILSKDANFLFTLNRGDKFKIGSIANNNYNTIVVIDSVMMFKLSYNNNILVILTTSNVLFYCRNNISKHWELEKSFSHDRSLDQKSIYINDTADVCLIRYSKHNIVIFKKTDRQWQHDSTVNNYPSDISFPFRVGNDKVLFSIQKNDYIKGNIFNIQIIDLEYFIDNIQGPNTLKSNLYSVEYERKNIYALPHPSNLAIIIIDLKSETMEILMRRKKTVVLSIQNLITSSYATIENMIQSYK